MYIILYYLDLSWSQYSIDGFYVVGTSNKVNHEFHKAIIDGVKQVTHIAQADKDGKIIGVPITQEGVILYDADLGLCSSMTNSKL